MPPMKMMMQASDGQPWTASPNSSARKKIINHGPAHKAKVSCAVDNLCFGDAVDEAVEHPGEK